MQPIFTVIGTPAWANPSRAGTRPDEDRRICSPSSPPPRAATRARTRAADGTTIGRVSKWIAWNEPNNPVFLKPQFVRAGAKWVMQSAKDYATICNAVVKGVKRSIGATRSPAASPRRGGTTSPGPPRSSVSPLAFLRAMKLAGAQGFDAYAHHPYYGSPAETPPPSRRPASVASQPTAVTLGNFDLLVKELTRLYGNMRIWVTEYGYQTNPPDRVYGVSLKNQATYMQQAWNKVAANPRVDVFIWFLLTDERRIDQGWQSGLYTVAGKAKPSRVVFKRLTR